MRRVAIRYACLMLACLFLPGTAFAQVRSVEVRTLRSFGYFLGDLVQSQVEIVADSGFSLQASSLPQPGPAAHWLDLRRIDVVEMSESGDAKRIRLNLTYQSFYAALDSRTMEIPGFAVTLESKAGGGTTTALAQVPAWSITVSALREVQPPRREDPADYLRPDGHAAPLDIRNLVRAAWFCAAMSLLALGLLARDRAWGPFARRPARVFAAALSRLRSLSRRPDKDTAYREALLALHRGIDGTDGRRVLADDLPGFLDRHPVFRDEAPGLAGFFAASRLAFFGRETAQARRQWSFAQAEAVLRRLAAAERRV